MIDLTRVARYTLHDQPYRWGSISDLFSTTDAAALSATYPGDHFKSVAAYGGEKDYKYEVRELIGMGAEVISHADQLSPAWLSLARDLLSPAYRIAMSLLTARDLTIVPMEVNVFHYDAGGLQGPHPDLSEKIVTHVLYFNRTWDPKCGGALHILRSSDPADIAAEVEPIVGNSAVLVRSAKSWHAVSRVADLCRESRRSVTVTFYNHGSVSTMWPPGELPDLHWYKN